MKPFYRRLPIGSASLAKWMFGQYTPVAKELAQSRADICNTPCPKNSSKGLYEDLVGAAADMARAAAGLRARMKLEVNGQKKLTICQACGCDLKLKVWQDLQKILKDMTKYEIDELWVKCWIRNEGKIKDDSIMWNPFNKVVQSHRYGTIDHELTNIERAKRGLRVPWIPDYGDEETKLPPIE